MLLWLLFFPFKKTGQRCTIFFTYVYIEKCRKKKFTSIFVLQILQLPEWSSKKYLHSPRKSFKLKWMYESSCVTSQRHFFGGEIHFCNPFYYPLLNITFNYFDVFVSYIAPVKRKRNRCYSAILFIATWLYSLCLQVPAFIQFVM